MDDSVVSTGELLAEIEDLHARLAESEEIIEAIRSGAVDGIVVSGAQGDQVFTLQGADHTYRTLIEQMGDGAATIAPEGHILYANQALCRWLKMDASVLLGTSIFDLVAEDAHLDLRTALETASGDSAILESTLAASDAVCIPVQMSLVRVAVEESGLSCIVFTDLTKQKRHAEELEKAVADRTSDLRFANEALADSESRYRSIFQTAANLITSVDRHGIIVDCNRRAKDVLGYEPDELVGQPMGKIIHPDCLDKAEESLRMILECGELYGREYRMVRKDGQVVDVTINAGALKDSAGRYIRTVCIIEDVTERKLAEEALRDSEASLRKAQEIAHLGFWEFDWQSGQITWSDELYRIFGMKPQEIQLTYDLLLEHVHPDDRSYHDTITGELAAEREVTFEYRLLRPDGEIRWVWGQGETICDTDGKRVKNVGTAQDITERKRAEQEALAAQEALLEQQRREKESVQTELEKVRDELVRKTRLATIGQVSGSIAHELRNPMGSVRNAAYYLRKHGVKNEARTTKFLEIIDGQTTRAERIIANLLDLTRAKEPVTREVDFRELVKDALEHLEEFDEVRCTFAARPDPFLVKVDSEQFRQVAVNLMNNASQAMNGNGELTIEASRNENTDIIVFRDNGPGVATDVRDRLFEPLVTTKATGTGLGLPICRQIVGQHGGTVELVEGDKPGAAFRISLPRGRNAEENEL